MESNSYAETRPYSDLGQYRLLIGIPDCSAKILLLITLLLIMRFFQMVARPRTGSNLHGPTKATIVVPDDI